MLCLRAMQGCPAVTDSGVNTLLLLCPQLEALHLNSLPAIQGLFVPTALRQCPQLTTLQVRGGVACCERGSAGLQLCSWSTSCSQCACCAPTRQAPAMQPAAGRAHCACVLQSPSAVRRPHLPSESGPVVLLLGLIANATCQQPARLSDAPAQLRVNNASRRLKRWTGCRWRICPRSRGLCCPRPCSTWSLLGGCRTCAQ